MRSVAAGGYVPGVRQSKQCGDGSRKGTSSERLGHPPGFDWASGLSGPGRVLLTVHTRLCRDSTAVKSAHCKKGSLAVVSGQTASVRPSQGLLAQSGRLGIPDSAREYILDTDASGHNVGAVLSQVQEGREVVVAYCSKSLSAAENNYCTTRKELLAVLKAVKHFRPYLYRRRFRLRTDHGSLIWLCKRAEPSSQVARWLEFLAEFSYRIEHRPWKKHGNADRLSRQPDKGYKQCFGIEKRGGGPSRFELETLPGYRVEYCWEHGQLVPAADKTAEAVRTLRTSPVLTGNVSEPRKLQEVVTDVYQAKKGGRQPSEEQLKQGCAKFWLFCQRWYSLQINRDKLLTITLTANGRHPKRERVACLATIRRELIWDAQKQAHAGVQRVIAKLQLRWYWSKMGRDVGLRVKQYEVCQTSKHGRLPGEARWRRLYAGRP